MVGLGVGGGLAARGGAARAGVTTTMGMLAVNHDAEGSLFFLARGPVCVFLFFRFLNDLAFSLFFSLLCSIFCLFFLPSSSGRAQKGEKKGKPGQRTWPRDGRPR